MRGITAAEVPPHLSSDYCIRCCRPFGNAEQVAIVTGGPAVRYREIAIEVCPKCIVRELDNQEMVSIYFSAGPLPLQEPERMKPIFTSNRPLIGFLSFSLIDNGFWRVGLHRGYPEVWSKDQTRSIPDPTGVFGYSEDYSLFAPIELFEGRLYHGIIRREFVDLRFPAKIRDARNTQ